MPGSLTPPDLLSSPPPAARGVVMNIPTWGQRLTALALHWGARAWLWRAVDLRIEGHMPAEGATLLVARHFHHFYDGCVIEAYAPRYVHVMVALDWVTRAWLRWAMEKACTLARWPAILRTDRLPAALASGIYRPDDGARYLRAAVRTTVRLLRDGQMVLIFPEAYPTIDRVYTPKQTADEFLPFRSGFLRLVELAQRDRAESVRIVPVGLDYRREANRWRITLRLGTPLFLTPTSDRVAVLQRVIDDVTALSRADAAR